MKKPKSFEEGMERLNQLLDRLASVETPLDESVELYSEAASLLEYCNSTLKNAQLQMEKIDLQLEQPQE